MPVYVDGCEGVMSQTFATECVRMKSWASEGNGDAIAEVTEVPGFSTGISTV